MRIGLEKKETGGYSPPVTRILIGDMSENHFFGGSGILAGGGTAGAAVAGALPMQPAA